MSFHAYANVSVRYFEFALCMKKIAGLYSLPKPISIRVITMEFREVFIQETVSIVVEAFHGDRSVLWFHLNMKERENSGKMFGFTEHINPQLCETNSISLHIQLKGTNEITQGTTLHTQYTETHTHIHKHTHTHTNTHPSRFNHCEQ